MAWLYSYIHIQIDLIYIIYIHTVHTLLLQDFFGCNDKTLNISLCSSFVENLLLLQACFSFTEYHSKTVRLEYQNLKSAQDAFNVFI